MKVEWTNTFTTDFDLDQAEEDFRFTMIDHNCDPDYADTAIYDAVEANWAFDGEGYIDTSPAIEQCAKALRERVGGIQMRMDLSPIPTFWWEDSVWKK